jgi:hypothetical protein
MNESIEFLNINPEVKTERLDESIIVINHPQIKSERQSDSPETLSEQPDAKRPRSGASYDDGSCEDRDTVQCPLEHQGQQHVESVMLSSQLSDMLIVEFKDEPTVPLADNENNELVSDAPKQHEQQQPAIIETSILEIKQEQDESPESTPASDHVDNQQDRDELEEVNKDKDTYELVPETLEQHEQMQTAAQDASLLEIQPTNDESSESTPRSGSTDQLQVKQEPEEAKDDDWYLILKSYKFPYYLIKKNPQIMEKFENLLSEKFKAVLIESEDKKEYLVKFDHLIFQEADFDEEKLRDTVRSTLLNFYEHHYATYEIKDFTRAPFELVRKRASELFSASPNVHLIYCSKPDQFVRIEGEKRIIKESTRQLLDSLKMF